METANIVALISFASILSGCGALFLVSRSFAVERNAEKPELKRLPMFSDAEVSGTIATFDSWFERTLYLSGTNLSSIEGALAIVLVTLGVAGAVFLATDHELLTLLSGMILIGGCFAALVIQARRRCIEFEQQFPMALDLLARAVRAGESFDQGLLLVGEAAEGLVGSEMKRCAKQLELGLSVQDCLRGLAQRVPLMDVRIFANAVAVYRDAGGNLPITLERLAEVVRDRQSYHRQLRSATGAGRISSMLITALGPILFLYLFVFQPEYGRKLIDDPMGKWMLIVAVVSQLTGIAWVLRLLKSDY